MLSKKRRITKGLFKEVFPKSKLFGTDHFTIRYLQSVGEGPRFGVVVSKKVLGSAVKRNLLKRRIYHILREETANSSKSVVVILFPKKSAVSLERGIFIKEIQSVLKRSGLL